MYKNIVVGYDGTERAMTPLNRRPIWPQHWAHDFTS